MTQTDSVHSTPRKTASKIDPAVLIAALIGGGDEQ